ncbi:hypothetical protein CER18_01780 [Bartonella tribocorum]|uniref:Uncharacterized protein n=1 Tax=Bartonella tribocorum TaxID=85701 RepID=A0A2M6UUK0_9HYPH|nr:hypothetical protein CER18_01780 [Bartonella tribocorum]
MKIIKQINNYLYNETFFSKDFYQRFSFFRNENLSYFGKKAVYLFLIEEKSIKAKKRPKHDLFSRFY